MSVSVYPQLTSGTLSQFPLKKRLQQRTVINNLADGSTVKLADANGGSTGWQLQYAGLTDAEAGSLQQFFESCEGSLNGFTFVDPAGNLLAWSEDLTNSVWQPGPLLAVTGGVADPLGGTQGFNLANSGAAAQGVSQTLNAPGGYVYTLSVYVQASAGRVRNSVDRQSKQERRHRSELDQSLIHRKRRPHGVLDRLRDSMRAGRRRDFRTAGGGATRAVRIQEEHHGRRLSKRAVSETTFFRSLPPRPIKTASQ